MRSFAFSPAALLRACGQTARVRRVEEVVRGWRTAGGVRSPGRQAPEEVRA